MKLHANRVVLALHTVFVVATAVVIFIAAMNDSLPKAWAPTVALIVAVLGAVAAGCTAVIKFLDGSQKFDALQARNQSLTPNEARELGGFRSGGVLPAGVTTGTQNTAIGDTAISSKPTKPETARRADPPPGVPQVVVEEDPVDGDEEDDEPPEPRRSRR